MKKVFFILLILFLVGGGVVIGAKVLEKIEEKRQNEQVGNKKSKRVEFPVDAVMPIKQDLQDQRMFSGSLKAWSVYDISSKVSGKIQKLPYNLGDQVAAKSLVVQIEDDEYVQQYQQVEADLELAKAKLNEANIVLKLRQQEYARVSTLAEKNINSRAQLESAETALFSQKATITMILAEVKRAEAALANAKVKLNETVLYADWSGKVNRFIGERFVDEGALVAANQPIVSIVEIDRLKASIFVIEQDYPNVKLDQVAEIRTDSYPNKVFKGKVSRISQILEESSRQAHVQLEIDNADKALKPGMFVRVFLEFANHENATVIPKSALVKKNNTKGVFEIDTKSNTVKFVEVQTGINAKDFVEIVSPKITKPVATLGNHLLADGFKVSIPNGIKEFKGGQQ